LGTLPPAISRNSFAEKPDCPQASTAGSVDAAEQGIAEEEALKQGLEGKSKEFVEKGAEVYAKA
jgi:hypothetical protein